MCHYIDILQIFYWYIRIYGHPTPQNGSIYLIFGEVGLRFNVEGLDPQKKGGEQTLSP